MDVPSSKIPKAAICKLCYTLVKVDNCKEHPCLSASAFVELENGYISPVIPTNDENIPANQQNTAPVMDVAYPSVSTDADLMTDVVNVSNMDEICEGDSLERLIEEVQKRKVLWKITEKKLHTKTYINQIWTELYQDLQVYFKDLDTMRKKWKNLVDTFHRELKNYKASMKSGSAAKTKPKWKYFELMTFLVDTDISYNNITESSIGDDANFECAASNNLNDVDSDNQDLKTPSRIGKRNTKRKRDEVLEELMESVKQIPPLHIPPLVIPPLPTEAPVNDTIKSFANFIESSLRTMDSEKANRKMFELHHKLMEN